MKDRVLELNSDVKSFEKIAMCHLDAVYRVAFAMCGNRNDADDLAQGTFLKAFERFETYKRGTNCKARLMSILRNKWIDLIRHKNVVGKVLELHEDMIDGREQNEENGCLNYENMLKRFSDAQVIKALLALPSQQRFVLFLVDVERLSHKDVAQIVNVPVGTVKSRASRAREVLRTQLLSYAKEMEFAGGER